MSFSQALVNQNPLPRLHRMSNAGYSQALFDCTHRLSMKTISLATSAWTNSSRSCPPIPLILRPCAPLFSILGPLNVLKLRLLRSHVNPLHVVPLPLQLPLTSCHHMLPNHLLHSLTLQLSRSILPILPILPLPTLSPLLFPLFLVLRSQYQTPLLVAAPRDGIRTPFFQTHTRTSSPLGTTSWCYTGRCSRHYSPTSSCSRDRT